MTKRMARQIIRKEHIRSSSMADGEWKIEGIKRPRRLKRALDLVGISHRFVNTQSSGIRVYINKHVAGNITKFSKIVTKLDERELDKASKLNNLINAFPCTPINLDGAGGNKVKSNAKGSYGEATALAEGIRLGYYVYQQYGVCPIDQLWMNNMGQVKRVSVKCGSGNGKNEKLMQYEDLLVYVNVDTKEVFIYERKNG